MFFECVSYELYMYNFHIVYAFLELVLQFSKHCTDLYEVLYLGFDLLVLAQLLISRDFFCTSLP